MTKAEALGRVNQAQREAAAGAIKHGWPREEMGPFQQQKFSEAVMAAVAEAETRAATLFDAIAHGDEAHRAWLKKAIEDHFAGRAVERPAGVGRTEAAVAARDEAWREWLRLRFSDEWISTCGDLPDRQLAPEEKAP
jgi:hypothetical protein